METVFRVGTTVYDEVFHKGLKGKIVEIKDWTNNCLGVAKVLIVHFGNFSYTYSMRGSLMAFGGQQVNYTMPVTLSTSPYIVGEIKQEPTPPNVQEAIEWCKENYDDYRENLCGHYLSEEYEKAFDAINSLILLRELYNDGWQPDWSDRTQSEKFNIIVQCNRLITTNTYVTHHLLSFKSEKIRDKFLEDQRELLEIAKPLL